MLRFGISQGHGGASIIEGSREFTLALGRLIGKSVRVLVCENYDELSQSFQQGTLDLAWLPPFLHIEAARRGAHLAAICERSGALTYRGAILVRADDPIRDVKDLRGVRAAWTDRNSAAGYVFPRLLIEAAGVPLERAFREELFLRSPREVCAAVADGRADLCACFATEIHADDPKQTLADVARIYPAAAWRLRVLAVTRSIPSDGIVLAAALDAPTRAKVTDALLRLNHDAQGVSGLTKLFFADRLVAVTPAVAAAIEHIGPLLRS